MNTRSDRADKFKIKLFASFKKEGLLKNQEAVVPTCRDPTSTEFS